MNMNTSVWNSVKTGAVVAAGAVMIALTPAQAADRVCFEAEDADTIVRPVEMADAGPMVADASGNRVLAIPQGAGSPPDVGGRATFTFSVPSDGYYQLWCRVWWEDGCGNSLGMKIDDHAEFTFGQDGTYKTWHWVKAPPRLRQLNLEAGKHTLTMTNREDGVAIDQILLVKSKRYVPVAIETPTMERRGAPRVVEDTGGAGAAVAPADLPWRVAGRHYSGKACE